MRAVLFLLGEVEPVDDGSDDGECDRKDPRGPRALLVGGVAVPGLGTLVHGALAVSLQTTEKEGKMGLTKV